MRKQFGAVILCGGKSRRMGQDKAQLKLGEKSFLETLIEKLSDCPEVLLSVEKSGDRKEYGIPVVPDRFPGCGPMSGLYSALEVCTLSAMLSIPCDAPLFDPSLGDALWEAMEEEDDAVIVQTRDERLQPLCGIYRKRCIPVFQRCLEDGQYSIQVAFASLNVRILRLADTDFHDWVLTNVNTPEDYRQISAPIRKRFFYNMKTCIGCGSCQVACKDSHRLLPGEYFRRSGMRMLTTREGPKMMPYSLSCNHCDRPACVAVCPTGAMYQQEDGIVLHNDAPCIGCGRCFWACPYGEISFSKTRGVAQKCDSCIALREKGMSPACVAACPTTSLRFGELPEDVGEPLCLPDLPKPDITGPSLRLRMPHELEEDDNG